MGYILTENGEADDVEDFHVISSGGRGSRSVVVDFTRSFDEHPEQRGCKKRGDRERGRGWGRRTGHCKPR